MQELEKKPLILKLSPQIEGIIFIQGNVEKSRAGAQGRRESQRAVDRYQIMR
jgi:hypothetical protein